MSISRNAPCPCGSGKKYKQCCGSLAQQPDSGSARTLASGMLVSQGTGGSGQPVAATDDTSVINRQIDVAYQLYYAGRIEEADQACQQAMAVRPDSAKAMNLAGMIAQHKGKLDLAVALLRKAAELEPRSPIVQGNLGSFLYMAGEADAAFDCFRKALELDPSYTGTLNNLGNIERDRGNLEQARSYYERVLSQQPGDAGVWLNLATIYKESDQHEQALACCQKALQLKPRYADAEFNISLIWLMKGMLAKGWAGYEARFGMERGAVPVRRFPPPLWQGKDLSGKTLLVWGEQGVGDEILFASVLPDVIRVAKRVIVECDPRLVALFVRSFPQADIIPRTDPVQGKALAPSIDYQCPAGSLARWFRPTRESFPQHQGFLLPDPARVAFWKNWLDTLGPGPKVGIAWRSMMRGMTRDRHYSTLKQWGKIFVNRQVTFINLQYDDCQAELAAARQQFEVDIHMPPGINLKDDLDEAAALTAALDLVITAGTSVSAIAGALGKETWRYTLESGWIKLGTDSVPWLPSVRSYEKKWDAPWESLLERIGNDLAAWSSGERKS